MIAKPHSAPSKGPVVPPERNILTQIRVQDANIQTVSFCPEDTVFFPQPVVYILGGGPSLSDLDINLLRNKFVIGCNDAYTLGTGLVDVVAFGDWCWWDTHKANVCAKYDGFVISTNGRARTDPRLKWVKRYPDGLHKDGVGWNFSTGAMAVNLALRFGAKTVVLLGIDMGRTRPTPEGDGRGPQNWHPNLLSNPPDSTYLRYLSGFRSIKQALPTVFPRTQIINANMDSKLDLFPKVPREEAFGWF